MHFEQSSPSSGILVPFCFRISPLFFSFISRTLVLGSQHLNRGLGRQRNVKQSLFIYLFLRGAVTLWLVCLTLDEAVWVSALVGMIALFSWATRFTLT